jgi:hypothetical protein
MTNPEWQTIIEVAYCEFETYCRKIHGYAVMPVTLAGLITWYKWIEEENQKRIQPQIQEVSEAPDD